MASSSVSVSDVEHDFALASRKAKVRSARANRAVNSLSTRDEVEKDDVDLYLPKYDQSSIVLYETNDASPKPVCRGLSKEKRPSARNPHSSKSGKGGRDRRKLREKRKSTGVMHLPSTESTGGSTGEEENNENSMPSGSLTNTLLKVAAPHEAERESTAVKGKSDSEGDADHEGHVSLDCSFKEDSKMSLKAENERLSSLIINKDKRIADLELQVAQMTQQMDDLKGENSKLIKKLSSQS